MKIKFLIFFVLLFLPNVFLAFGMDPEIQKSIKGWRVGREIPPQLLSFSSDETEPVSYCELGNYGNNLSDYLRESENVELFQALLFDKKADRNAVWSASSRIISLKGVEYLANLVEEHWKLEPTPNNSEICILRQVLMVPYSSLRVARFEKSSLAAGEAEAALRKMEAELLEGTTWEKVYAKYAKLFPDGRPSDDGQTGRTLLCYLFAGDITVSGFVPETRTIWHTLPKEYLKVFFYERKRSLIFSDEQGVSLYFSEKFFEGLKP